ncbi:hypothetical protein HPB52_003497 [Rhipicephalus sanguineus]|uniref:Uncharacterized protein n=1 Tax=Rhipicephalus sanguineus TaxID=34632 RepID=A0A9D4T6S1_RHISA|nr:hypothetical protein HPB52_003497 [Rhipicephalus sanguineus]
MSLADRRERLEDRRDTTAGLSVSLCGAQLKLSCRGPGGNESARAVAAAALGRVGEDGPRPRRPRSAGAARLHLGRSAFRRPTQRPTVPLRWLPPPDHHTRLAVAAKGEPGRRQQGGHWAHDNMRRQRRQFRSLGDLSCFFFHLFWFH